MSSRSPHHPVPIAARHPFAWIEERSQPRVLLALGILLAASTLALGVAGAPLVNEIAPQGIISYEFAGTADRAGRMLESWSARTRELAMLNLGLDYLYLFVYPAFLSLGCVRTARRLGASRRAGTAALAKLGSALSWPVLLSGGLDAVENFGLIQQLAHAPSDSWAGLAWWCAATKFALVAAGFAYLGVAGLFGLRSGMPGLGELAS